MRVCETYTFRFLSIHEVKKGSNWRKFSLQVVLPNNKNNCTSGNLSRRFFICEFCGFASCLDKEPTPFEGIPSLLEELDLVQVADCLCGLRNLHRLDPCGA